MANGKWSEVLEKAKQEDKLIFLDCYTVWCGPCKGLDKNIFTQKEVGDYFNSRFVCAKMDMEKDDGAMLYDKYKAFIPGFPTMLFIDGEGEVKHSIVGFKEADVLIKAAKAGLSGMTVDVMRQKYNDGERDVAFIRDYIEVLDFAFKKDEIKSVVTEFMNSIPIERLKERDVIELYMPFITDIKSKEVEYIVKNMTHFKYKIEGLDRYELAEKLNYAMNREVSALVVITHKDGRTMDIKPNIERLNYLKSLQKYNNFKYDGVYTSKFYIYSLLVEERWQEAADALVLCDKMGVIGGSTLYKSEIIRYIFERYNKKSTTAQLFEMLNGDVDRYSEKERVSTYFIFDLLADMAQRLNKKELSKEYREFYDTEKAKAEEKFKEYLK